MAVTAARNHHTARTYLNGGNHERRRREVPSTYSEAVERRRIIAAAKRVSKGAGGRAGIYARDLERESDVVNGTRNHRHRARLAAGAMALACGMRCSEYTGGGTVELHTDGRKEAASKPMDKKDVRFGMGDDGNRFVDITLERTKWWNLAVTFRMHETISRVDPYRLIRETYVSSPRSQGPLFTTTRGGNVAIKRADVTALCNRIQARSKAPKTKLTPHSFRVGAARSLLRAGVERTHIDGWCRWRGMSGDRYLQLTPDDIEYAMTAPKGHRITERIFGCRVRLSRRELGSTNHTRSTKRGRV